MRNYFIILLISSVIVFQACDDSGLLPSSIPKGTVTFRQKNFKHIDPYVEGIFELWLRLDSAGNMTDYSLGRFNINENGELTDSLGGPVQFKYQGDTNNLYQARFAFITVEPPGDYNSTPSNSVLVSGGTAIVFDSLYASMNIAGSLALGAAGEKLLSGEHTSYMINTPTSSPSDCLKGMWFCDTAGNSYFPSGLNMPSSGWVYEGWVVNKSNPQNRINYTTGKFTSPYGPDFDGAGPCAGPNPPYSSPGQDWILPDCPFGKPKIQNLSSYDYEILITLEPSFEQQSTTAYDNPFIITLYKQSVIFPLSGCLRKDWVLNQRATFPSASVRIAYRN